jgi:F-box and leucine-rich repeat protein 13
VKAPQLQQVFHHHNLRVLNLGFMDDVSDEAFLLLSSSLTPSSSASSTSSAASTITSSTSTTTRTRIISPLRILNLCRSKITDSTMFRMVQMQELEEIRVPWCAGITDTGIVALARTCTRLKVIDLRSCSITDIALAAIGALCIQLVELDLSWCFHVSDEGLLQLLPSQHARQQDASTLRKLSLIWCPQVTDITCTILARISSLDCVYVNGCMSITEEGMNTLTSRGIEIVT